MNYLTNYYKNLSEQLQEKVNHLQKLLEKKDTEKVLVTGYKITSAPPGGSAGMEVYGRLIFGKGGKPGTGVVVKPVDVHAGLRMLGGTPSSKIGTSETPVIRVAKRDLTPDHYDGRDRDLRGDLPELLHGKREEEIRALLPKTQDNQDFIDSLRDMGLFRHKLLPSSRRWENEDLDS